jgi:hypothetical protein
MILTNLLPRKPTTLMVIYRGVDNFEANFESEGMIDEDKTGLAPSLKRSRYWTDGTSLTFRNTTSNLFFKILQIGLHNVWYGNKAGYGE